MKVEIKYKPSYSLAVVDLEQNENIKAESGAMVSKSSNVTIETSKAQKGGFLKSLKSAILGGESFWMNTFTASGSAGQVTLTPTLPGDIAQINLNGTVFVQSSSFMASSPALEIDTKFQGLKGFFSGESLFFLKISGNGPLMLSSYGAIEEMAVNGEFIIDTGHIVAFDETLQYKVKKFGGWKSFFFGGEGLVAYFTGSGRIWVQSRNVPALGAWFSKDLPPRKG